MSLSYQIVNEQIKLNERWEYFKQGCLIWIKAYYQSKNIDKKIIDESIKKQRQNFQKLQNGLRNGNYQKYFEQFKKNRDKKYLLKDKVEIDWIDYQKDGGSYVSIMTNENSQQENKKQQRINYFLNYRNMIRYLSLMKYQFKYIAEHPLSYEYSQEKTYFIYQVQRGISLDQQKYKNQNELFILIFLRDLVYAVQQLQKHNIFHADIAYRNMILFNCTQQQLQIIFNGSDRQRIRQIIQKMRFKLIDFEEAYFMNTRQQNKINNCGYFYAIAKLHSQLQIDQSSLKNIKEITQQQNIQNFIQNKLYKRCHSHKIVSILEQKEDKMNSQRKNKIISLTQQRKYQELKIYLKDSINKLI